MKRSLATPATDHDTTPSAANKTPSSTNHASPTSLSHSHSLLILAESSKLLFTLFFLVAFRITDGMHSFEMLEELRFVPERLQAHTACHAVVFVVE